MLLDKLTPLSERRSLTSLQIERKMAVAGVPGFEPGMAIPKTAALPLGYTPTLPRLADSKCISIRQGLSLIN